MLSSPPETQAHLYCFHRAGIEEPFVDPYAKIQRQLDEHSSILTEHTRRFDEHTARFDEHDRRFDEHDRRFDDVDRQLVELRQELKDEVRGLHLRFESLEDTMRLVAERVSEFNRENQTIRSRVNHLETSQINTDLRLVALERKKRKS